MKIFKMISLFVALSIMSCASNKEQVDLVITNAKIYIVNDAFEIVEAIAIHEGKIIFTGTTQELNDKFEAKETIDAKNQFVYPGFYDAHAHLYSLGINMQTVNLRNTKSFEEVVERVVAFQKERNTNFIRGRGWDQNDWTIKEFPSREQLDELFPDVPTAMVRGDIFSRLEQLDSGQYGALILAACGLKRMDLEERISQAFTIDQVIPSASQGILAIQGRAGENYDYLKCVHSEESAFISMAERSLLRYLNRAGSSGVAAYASLHGDELELVALHVNREGKLLRSKTRGPKAEAEKLGNLLGAELLEGRVRPWR